MIIECPDCEGEVEVGLYWTDCGTPANHRWLEVDTIDRLSCKCDPTQAWKDRVGEKALEIAAEGDEPSGDY